MAELTPLVNFVYHFTEAQHNADRTRFTVQLTFFNTTREDFANQVAAAQIDDQLKPHPDIGSIHKCLRHVINPGFRLTRENADALAAELDDGDLNTCIRTFAGQINNQVNNETQLFNCFSTVLEYLSRSVSFLLTKTILASGLYKEVYTWTSQLPALEAAVTDMLLALGSRTETNAEALRLVGIRHESCDKYLTYKNMSTTAHWDTLRVHLRGFDVNFVNFRWAEFAVRFADRTIWWTHARPSDTQLGTLLEDPDLAGFSKRLDTVVEKIRSYQPSRDITNVSKKNRVIQRVCLIKADLQAFKDGDGRNVSKAKLMIDGLKFLNKQLETLHLEDGIPYTTESTGIDPSEVASSLEDLEEYVNEQDNLKKQKELSQKLNSMEFSRHMPGVSIVKLTGPENYLSWLNWYNSMSRMVSNSITKVTLVKQSLTSKTDQRFLENVSNLREIIEFIKNKYSSKDEILYTELNKLYKMRRCGSNMKLMAANSEKFLCTAALFDLHGLQPKIDRVCRSRIIDKILTVNQQQQYLYDLVKAETLWKAKYEVRRQVDDEEEGNVQEITLETGESKNVSFQPGHASGSSSTPFNTPLASPTVSSHSNPMVELVPPNGTTDNKLTTEQFESIMEKLKRAHFLRHHKRYFETVRRILHLSSTFYHEQGDNKFNTHFKYGGSYRHPNYDYNYRTEAVADKVLCPLCKKHHKPALVWCFMFKKQGVEERHKTIATMFKNCCRSCLAFDGQDSNHKGGVCSIQKEKDLKCKICSSTKHHSLLHKTFNQPSGNHRGGFPSRARGQGRGGGRGRGRGGTGPGARAGGTRRGGQFKRQTRKQRISNSEKAFMLDDNEDCTCCDHQEDTHHHTHVVGVNMNQPLKVEFQGLQAFTNKGQTCKIHNGLRNACKKHERMAKHIIKGHPDSREFYMALTSICDVQGQKKTPEKAVVLWDTASSLSFVSKELCRRARFPEVGQWQGTVSTIESERRSRYTIHMVTLKDHQGKIYQTPCLAIEFIGTKDKVPEHIFSYIGKVAKINDENLERVHGNIDILLGVASLTKFPMMVECPGQESLDEKLPNIKIVQCSLSAQLIPFGFYSIHKLPWSKSKVENFGIFSQGTISLKNTKNLRLKIPIRNPVTNDREKEDGQGHDHGQRELEECKPSSPPASLSPLTQLSQLSLPWTPVIQSKTSRLKRSKSVPRERFREAANFWREKTQAPTPGDEDLVQEISNHYHNMARKSRQDVDEINCERIRPISSCFSSQRRLKGLLDNFTFSDFTVDENKCTITLQCDDLCPTHRKIEDTKQILRRTVPDSYVSMVGDNFMVRAGGGTCSKKSE